MSNARFEVCDVATLDRGRLNGLLWDRRRDDRGSTETKIETTTEFSA
jgi:hypothetical protein